MNPSNPRSAIHNPQLIRSQISPTMVRSFSFAKGAPAGKETEPEVPTDLRIFERDGKEGVGEIYLHQMFWLFDKNRDNHIDETEWNAILKTPYNNSLLAIRPGGDGDVSSTHIAYQVKRGAPEVPSPLYYQGRIYMVRNGGILTCIDVESGKPLWQKDALKEFRAELAIDPYDYMSNLQVGAMLRQDQKYDEAKTYLTRALETRPGDLAVRYQLAAIDLSEGKAELARRELESIVKESPTFTEAHVTLSLAYYRLKRPADGNREKGIVEKLTAEAQAKQAKAVIQSLLSQADTGAIQLVHISPQQFRRAWDLRQKYHDKPDISFVDFTSMIVMQDLGITDTSANSLWAFFGRSPPRSV